MGKAPTATFSYSCRSLTCNFDASASSDPDGSIVEYEWVFLDTYETIRSPSPTVSHTFKSADSYYVYLYVKDDDGAWGSAVALVDLRVPFELTSQLVRQGKRARADLKWSGAMTDRVDVYRNGAKIATVENSGSYSEPVSGTGSTFTYRVCDLGSTRCSNESTVKL